MCVYVFVPVCLSRATFLKMGSGTRQEREGVEELAKGLRQGGNSRMLCLCVCVCVKAQNKRFCPVLLLMKKEKINEQERKRLTNLRKKL